MSATNKAVVGERVIEAGSKITVKGQSDEFLTHIDNIISVTSLEKESLADAISSHTLAVNTIDKRVNGTYIIFTIPLKNNRDEGTLKADIFKYRLKNMLQKDIIQIE